MNNAAVALDGVLPLETTERIDQMLQIIQDYEGPERNHGTLSERAEAITIGVQGGLVACNDWFPQTPLIVTA